VNIGQFHHINRVARPRGSPRNLLKFKPLPTAVSHVPTRRRSKIGGIYRRANNESSGAAVDVVRY